MRSQAQNYVDFLCSNAAIPEDVKQWVRAEVPSAFGRLGGVPSGTIVHDFVYDAPDSGGPRDLSLVIHLSQTIGRINFIDRHTDALVVDEYDVLSSPDGTASFIRDPMRSDRSLAEARALAARFQAATMQ